MSIKGLITNQTIIIDDHKRGSGEVKNWDNKTAEIHIDKITEYPIEGKKQKVRIRVPLNSNQEVRIENGRKNQLKEIPGKLKKEIITAFKDKETRENFIKDVIETLKDYATVLSSEVRAREVLKRLSQHFGLEWTNEIIATYVNDTLQKYTETYKDKEGNDFYITLERDKIKIGQNNGKALHQIKIKQK